MSRSAIDEYLADLDEPKRTTLQALRSTILDVIPDAEECISYNMPGFRLDGRVVAGFAAFKRHLSYFPHSGSVLEVVARESPHLLDFPGVSVTTKGTLQFAVDTPLSRDLVAALIEVRLALPR